MVDTIFMIHGMWGNSWYWDNYKSFFEAKGYRVVTTNLRFHDMNPIDTPNPQLGITSLLDYASDLEEEIRKLGEKPIIMGHSMGGLLAQILGSRGLAKTLVLLTPAAPAGILALKLSVIKSFLSMLMTWGFWRKPIRHTFKETAYSILNLLPYEEQQAAYDKSVFESGKAVFETGFWLFDTNRASRVDELKVTCPVLVIAGSKDKITPASVVQKVARKYKANYKEFPNHAHWVVAEPDWQEVTEYVFDWLGQIQNKVVN